MAGRALAVCDRLEPSLRTEILDSINTYLHTNDQHQNSLKAAWKVLIEIGGGSMARLCLSMKHYQCLLSYKNAIEQYNKIKYSLSANITNFASRVAERCINSNTLDISYISEIDDELKIFALYFKDQGGAWRFLAFGLTGF